MKNKIILSTLLISSSTLAGGLDRTPIPINHLYADGDYLEVGFSMADPTVSGTHQADEASLGGASKKTGNITNGKTLPHFYYKSAINEDIDIITGYYAPYGASISYDSGLLAGTDVELETQEISSIAKYKFNENFALHGGARYIKSDVSAELPYLAGYEASGSNDGEFGYVVGGSYSINDIGFRADLTYQNEINLKQAGPETFTGHPNPAVNNVTVETEADLIMPQTVTLNIKSGVAENTLVGLRVKWAEWEKFELAPTYFGQAMNGAKVADFKEDSLDTTFLIGHKVNDRLSIAGTYSYVERKGAGTTLNPVDGLQAFGLSGSYAVDKFKMLFSMVYADMNTVSLETTGGLPVATTFDNSSGLLISTSLRYAL